MSSSHVTTWVQHRIAQLTPWDLGVPSDTDEDLVAAARVAAGAIWFPHSSLFRRHFSLSVDGLQVASGCDGLTAFTGFYGQFGEQALAHDGWCFTRTEGGVMVRVRVTLREKTPFLEAQRTITLMRTSRESPHHVLVREEVLLS